MLVWRGGCVWRWRYPILDFAQIHLCVSAPLRQDVFHHRITASGSVVAARQMGTTVATV